MKHIVLHTFVLMLSLTSSALAVVPDNNKIVFQILRNGDAFGMHKIEFEKDESGELTANIDINMEFALGPITLFNYDHTNKEVWQGDQMISMNSQTDDDGTDYNVDANWGNDSVSITVNGERYEAEKSLYTTSYWNPVTIKSNKLLNTQKGKIEDISVTKLPTEELIVAGEKRTAQPFDIQASVPIKIYYDVETSQWIGLEFKVRGSEMVYKRLTPVKETFGG